MWSHRGNSDNHRMLFEMVSHAAASSPSMQYARKTPPAAQKIGGQFRNHSFPGSVLLTMLLVHSCNIAWWLTRFNFYY